MKDIIENGHFPDTNIKKLLTSLFHYSSEKHEQYLFDLLVKLLIIILLHEAVLKRLLFEMSKINGTIDPNGGKIDCAHDLCCN